MSLKRRQFTKEFKLQVIREIEAGKSQSVVAREHQLSVTTIVRVAQATPLVQRSGVCR